MRERKWSVALFTVLVLGATAPAWARGMHGGRGFGPPGGPSSGSFLQRLIFPCRATCFDTFRQCVDTADSVAASCITAACSAEVAAAQTACAEDRTTDACRSAVSALRDCADACLDTRTLTIDGCHDDLRDCREGCESAE